MSLQNHHPLLSQDQKLNFHADTFASNTSSLCGVHHCITMSHGLHHVQEWVQVSVHNFHSLLSQTDISISIQLGFHPIHPSAQSPPLHCHVPVLTMHGIQSASRRMSSVLQAAMQEKQILLRQAYKQSTDAEAKCKQLQQQLDQTIECCL